MYKKVKLQFVSSYIGYQQLKSANQTEIEGDYCI